MNIDLISWFEPDVMLAAAGLLPNLWAVAAICLVWTAVLVVLCVPGILMPTAISAGALLGPWAGVALVVAGAVCGSQVLFAVSRAVPGGRLDRLASKLPSVQSGMARHGLWYVATLRLIGVPHFLVTVASAATPMRSRTFLAANALGFFPALCLAALAGSAI